MIYLDYAASAPPYPEALSAMSAAAAESFGNPGAIHGAGAQARQILQESRKTLAQVLKVRPEEVYFTSGGTEANNWALALGCAGTRKKHIVCSAAEHSSVLEPLKMLEGKGYAVSRVFPDRQGRITPEAVEAALRPDTALLCVQAVNNETGVMQDVDALASLARKKGVVFFCDAVQSFGHVSQSLHKADLFSLSAHKFGGPRGVGCLVIRQRVLPVPLILGGGQEFGMRSGTENVPAIAGFALAARLADRALSREQSRLEALRQQLEQGLGQLCPELEVAGGEACRSGITCCRFPGHAAEALVTRLDAFGICASPGAACAAAKGEASHVLRAMGYSSKEAAEFVRFSPGRLTTQEEIRQVLRAMDRILAP